MGKMKTNKIKSNLANTSKIKQNVALSLLCLPGVIWVICFCYLPMFGVIVAFKDYNYIDGILHSPWVGFRYFKYFFTSNMRLFFFSDTSSLPPKCICKFYYTHLCEYATVKHTFLSECFPYICFYFAIYYLSAEFRCKYNMVLTSLYGTALISFTYNLIFFCLNFMVHFKTNIIHSYLINVFIIR